MSEWKIRCAYALIATLCVLTFQNLVNYTRQLSSKKTQADAAKNPTHSAAVAANFDSREEWHQLKIRLQLYSLFNSLGSDKTLHANDNFGVIILDPDFYRGKYTDISHGSILEVCAIQPFSVPALTRLPLLSPFASDSGGCVYESYGYQYLPTRRPAGNYENVDPCELAGARGFTHLVLIDKKHDSFAEIRVNCAK
jgi:hypothetical protein